MAAFSGARRRASRDDDLAHVRAGHPPAGGDGQPRPGDIDRDVGHGSLADDVIPRKVRARRPCAPVHGAEGTWRTAMDDHHEATLGSEKSPRLGQHQPDVDGREQVEQVGDRHDVGTSRGQGDGPGVRHEPLRVRVCASEPMACPGQHAGSRVNQDQRGEIGLAPGQGQRHGSRTRRHIDHPLARGGRGQPGGRAKRGALEPQLAIVGTRAGVEECGEMIHEAILPTGRPAATAAANSRRHLASSYSACMTSACMT